MKSIFALAPSLMVAVVAYGGDISPISDLTALRPDSADAVAPNTEALVAQGNYTDLATVDRSGASTGNARGVNYTEIDQLGLSNQAAVIQGAGRTKVTQSGANNSAAVDSLLIVH